MNYNFAQATTRTFEEKATIWQQKKEEDKKALFLRRNSVFRWFSRRHYLYICVPLVGKA